MGEAVRLRPIEEHELQQLVRLLWDPEAPGEHQWFGFHMDKARDIERRWRDDGLIGRDSSFLAVGVEDGTCAGWVMWRPVGDSANLEIGIALFEDYRGRGIGTEAQRQLVEYLFSTTTANRLQAGTEADNVAEGVQRGLHFRGGAWRDSVMYGLTRDDWRNNDAD